jgi:hypothetical protein
VRTPDETLHSDQKLQFPLNRLKVRFLAQRVKEWVGLQIQQSRIAQAHCGVNLF